MRVLHNFKLTSKDSSCEIRN